MVLQSIEIGCFNGHLLVRFMVVLTIVSGSLAERTQLLAYLFFSIFMTAFIYPVIVHLTWGGGILGDMGYLDFAGSGIVHLVGGTAGYIGSTIIGPRLNRYSYIDDNRNELFKPHNVPMVVLGTLILWFGWYGFNCERFSVRSYRRK